MDPYSLSVEREASKNIEENERECFKDAIVSSRSLNRGFTESTNLRHALPMIAACIVAASYHIAVGLTMAYSAALIPKLKNETGDLLPSDSQKAWIASIVIIVAPVGAFIGGFLMEAVGCLKTIQIATIPCTIGWLLIAMAKDIPMILGGRVLNGLATALGTTPAIVYITEVAKPELRGPLISTGPTLASLGMLISYAKGAYLPWRLVAWLSIAYAAVPLLLIFFVPESPTWLVMKGRFEDARKSCEWLCKREPNQGKNTAAEVQFNMIMKENEIKLAEMKKNTHGNFNMKLRAFLKPTGWKPMLILTLLFGFQQFTGIYMTLFYAVNFFESIEAGMDAFTASILIGLTRLLCSVASTYLLKRCKRRLLVMTSCFGMAICTGISGYFTMKIQEGDKSMNWVPIVCMVLYVVMSMVGMLTIPWTMTAELFPTEIRGIANAISYSTANVLMFIAVQSYFQLQDLFHGVAGLQWFFMVVSLAACVFTWFLLPETHGKKLSEIEEYFQNNFLAVGSEGKAKKRRAKRRAEQKARAEAAQPLNPKPNAVV